jgi:predicted small secreted protein
MKKFSLLGWGILALLSVVYLYGCNAFRGAGKDLSDTGKHLANVGN